MNMTQTIAVPRLNVSIGVTYIPPVRLRSIMRCANGSPMYAMPATEMHTSGTDTSPRIITEVRSASTVDAVIASRMRSSCPR